MLFTHHTLGYLLLHNGGLCTGYLLDWNTIWLIYFVFAYIELTVETPDNEALLLLTSELSTSLLLTQTSDFFKAFWKSWHLIR